MMNINDLPDVSFIDNLTFDDLVSQMVQSFTDKYEELTGNQIALAPADVNRMLLQACATQIYQAMQYVDRAGKLNLLKYSYGEYLDNIAALKGVERKEATASTVTIRFTLSEIRNTNTTIPSGTKVSTGNYDIYWELKNEVVIPAGNSYIDCELICTEEGSSSNGYTIGTVTELVDTVPYVESVTNVSISAGGTDDEDDETLAERVYLAPASYSVAGSEAAYIYHVKNSNSAITDVKIRTNNDVAPGVIYILFLIDGRIPTDEENQTVLDYLNESGVKVLTDKIVVMSPIKYEFSVNLKYYISKNNAAKESEIKTSIENAVDEFIEESTSKIGQSIYPSALYQKVMNAGAADVEILYPDCYP
jgi:phage-related baseplate assembly protein